MRPNLSSRIIDRQEPREEALSGRIVLRSKKEPTDETAGRRHSKQSYGYVRPEPNRHDHHPLLLDGEKRAAVVRQSPEMESERFRLNRTRSKTASHMRDEQ